MRQLPKSLLVLWFNSVVRPLKENYFSSLTISKCTHDDKTRTYLLALLLVLLSADVSFHLLVGCHRDVAYLTMAICASALRLLSFVTVRGILVRRRRHNRKQRWTNCSRFGYCKVWLRGRHCRNRWCCCFDWTWKGLDWRRSLIDGGWGRRYCKRCGLTWFIQGLNECRSDPETACIIHLGLLPENSLKLSLFLL